MIGVFDVVAATMSTTTHHRYLVLLLLGCWINHVDAKSALKLAEASTKKKLPTPLIVIDPVAGGAIVVQQPTTGEKIGDEETTEDKQIIDLLDVVSSATYNYTADSDDQFSANETLTVVDDKSGESLLTTTPPTFAGNLPVVSNSEVSQPVASSQQYTVEATTVATVPTPTAAPPTHVINTRDDEEDKLSPAPCSRFVTTYDYLPAVAANCRQLGAFDGATVSFNISATRHLTSGIVTESACKAACDQRADCHAVAHSVENPPYCVLYADRTHRRGGSCDVDRRVTWKLFETVPGCVKRGQPLECGATGVEDRRYGRFNVTNCGRPIVFHIPPIYRNLLHQCRLKCYADPRCLMMVWYSNKQQDQCHLYAHNSYYEEGVPAGQRPCQLQRATRGNQFEFTRIWEKRCRCHLTDPAQMVDSCGQPATTS